MRGESRTCLGRCPRVGSCGYGMHAQKSPEIAPGLFCIALAGAAGAKEEPKPYFASFSISFSTMLAGTSS
jgi:hypothetical protein